MFVIIKHLMTRPRLPFACALACCLWMWARSESVCQIRVPSRAGNSDIQGCDLREVCCEGYEGSPGDCRPLCSPSCVNAQCTGPQQCTCDVGYETVGGTKYSKMGCQPKCHACRFGDCVAPGVCRCWPAYAEQQPLLGCQPVAKLLLPAEKCLGNCSSWRQYFSGSPLLAEAPKRINICRNTQPEPCLKLEQCVCDSLNHLLICQNLVNQLAQQYACEEIGKSYQTVHKNQSNHTFKHQYINREYQALQKVQFGLDQFYQADHTVKIKPTYRKVQKKKIQHVDQTDQPTSIQHVDEKGKEVQIGQSDHTVKIQHINREDQAAQKYQINQFNQANHTVKTQPIDRKYHVAQKDQTNHTMKIQDVHQNSQTVQVGQSDRTAKIHPIDQRHQVARKFETNHSVKIQHIDPKDQVTQNPTRNQHLDQKGQTIEINQPDLRDNTNHRVKIQYGHQKKHADQIGLSDHTVKNHTTHQKDEATKDPTKIQHVYQKGKAIQSVHTVKIQYVDQKKHVVQIDSSDHTAKIPPIDRKDQVVRNDNTLHTVKIQHRNDHIDQSGKKNKANRTVNVHEVDQKDRKHSAVSVYQTNSSAWTQSEDQNSLTAPTVEEYQTNPLARRDQKLQGTHEVHHAHRKDERDRKVVRTGQRNRRIEPKNPPSSALTNRSDLEFKNVKNHENLLNRAGLAMHLTDRLYNKDSTDQLTKRMHKKDDSTIENANRTNQKANQQFETHRVRHKALTDRKGQPDQSINSRQGITTPQKFSYKDNDKSQQSNIIVGSIVLGCIIVVIVAIVSVAALCFRAKSPFYTSATQGS